MVVTSRVPVRIDFAGAWTDVPVFAGAAGGAVVNAAIDRYVEGRLEVHENPERGEHGIRVSYHCDLPAGSGLGTSAALNVCWLSLVESQLDPSFDYRTMIAELAFKLEDLLGILGGKQDQYASALGGFNYLRFSDQVEVEALTLSDSFTAELEGRIVLCNTGKSRLSSTIHRSVWDAFRHGFPQTVKALYSLRDGAIQMRDALLKEDLAMVTELIGESWRNQKALDPSVTNERIETLFEAAIAAGAMSGKACGAGGGGCLMFLADSAKRPSVVDAVSQLGAGIIEFRFDFRGLQLFKES